MIIYKITNLINGKIYIGQTIRSLESRWLSHCSSSSLCLYLSNSIKKYGKENFNVSVLKKCSSLQEMNYYEKFFIKSLNSLAPNGYNLRDGGVDGIFSDLSKEKMSKAHIGNKYSLGYRQTKETKLKKSAICKTKVKIFCSNGITYDSISQASRDLNIEKKRISDVVSGRKKTYKGFSFKRLENEL